MGRESGRAACPARSSTWMRKDAHVAPNRNDDTNASPSRRRLTRAERRTIAGAFISAAVLLAAYVWLWLSNIPPQLGWLAGVLLNLGTAALLVVPIEWFSARLRRRVADVDARQTEAVTRVRSEAEQLGQRVETIDAKVTNLAELQEKFAATTSRRRAEDEELFRDLGVLAPTQAAVSQALRRASELGLVSTRGVRVPVAAGADLRLVFLAEGDDQLTLRLENIRGTEYQRWTWRPDQDALDLFTTVADALERAQEPRPLDVQFALQRLSATLMTALTYQTSRPIIEYFPEQWALTDDALVTADHRWYSITHSRKDRLSMDLHVRQKTWIDEDSYESAYEVASYLFPLTAEQEEVGSR